MRRSGLVAENAFFANKTGESERGGGLWETITTGVTVLQLVA